MRTLILLLVLCSCTEVIEPFPIKVKPFDANGTELYRITRCASEEVYHWNYWTNETTLVTNWCPTGECESETVGKGMLFVNDRSLKLGKW